MSHVDTACPIATPSGSVQYPLNAIGPEMATRIACKLCEDGWVSDERHYDGDMIADLAAVIQRAANLPA